MMKRVLAFVTSLALLSPLPAQAACQQWTVSGSYVLHQTNGYSPRIELQQSGMEIGGTGQYRESGRVVRGTIDGGAIRGTEIFFSIAWRNRTVGSYRGTINSVSGLMVGETEDMRAAGSPTANWQSDRPAICVDVVAKPASPAPPPVAVVPRLPVDHGQVMAKGFPGVWETQTSAGLRYTLTLTRGSGARITGQFASLDNALLNGTLEGTLDDAASKLSFTFAQPKASNAGQGTFFLASKDAIDGRYTLNSSPGNVTLWTGTRKK